MDADVEYLAPPPSPRPSKQQLAGRLPEISIVSLKSSGESASDPEELAPPKPRPSYRQLPLHSLETTPLRSPDEFELSDSEEPSTLTLPTRPLEPPEAFEDVDNIHEQLRDPGAPGPSGLSLLSSGFEPPRAASAFALPTSPASASPNSPHHPSRVARKQSRYALGGRSGLKRPRDSTPTPSAERYFDGAADTEHAEHVEHVRIGEDVEHAKGVGASENSALQDSPTPLPQRRGRVRQRRTSVVWSSESRSYVRRRRSRTPAFEPDLPGHGETTYMAVPEDRSLVVEDGSQLYPVQREQSRTGRYRLFVGSRNGHYLADYHHEKKFEEIKRSKQLDEWDKPEDKQIQDFGAKHDVSPRWDKKWATQHGNASDPCTWMNETWGPEIRDYEPEERPMGRRGTHPSMTGKLNAQYNGGRKSGKWLSSGECKTPERQNGKKLKKQDQEPTAPAMERETRPTAHTTDPDPDDMVEERPKSRPILHVRKGSTSANTFCSVCKVKEHVDGGPLLVCDRCRMDAYCSRECQEKNAAWHRQTCKPPEEQAGKRPRKLTLSDLLPDDPMAVNEDDRTVDSDRLFNKCTAISAGISSAISSITKRFAPHQSVDQTDGPSSEVSDVISKISKDFAKKQLADRPASPTPESERAMVGEVSSLNEDLNNYVKTSEMDELQRQHRALLLGQAKNNAELARIESERAKMDELAADVVEQYGVHPIVEYRVIDNRWLEYLVEYPRGEVRVYCHYPSQRYALIVGRRSGFQP